MFIIYIRKYIRMGAHEKVNIVTLYTSDITSSDTVEF